MASSNRRRCPTKVTPRSFKSSVVSFGSIVWSIALSRNAGGVLFKPQFAQPIGDLDRHRQDLVVAQLSAAPPSGRIFYIERERVD
jgi:hypothetical protein